MAAERSDVLSVSALLMGANGDVLHSAALTGETRRNVYYAEPLNIEHIPPQDVKQVVIVAEIRVMSMQPADIQAGGEGIIIRWPAGVLQL